MKKFEFFIKNIYRIIIIKPGRNDKPVRMVNDGVTADPVDVLFRNALRKDNLITVDDNELRDVLEQRVAAKTFSKPHKNSLADFLLPLFNLRNFEIKMTAITIALIMFMRIGPIMNHSSNRSIPPAFLADTLIDSSLLQLRLPDSSLRIP